MKYCDLIGAATIVAAHTISVYECDQTLLPRAPPSNKKSEHRKRVGNARLGQYIEKKQKLTCEREGGGGGRV